MTRYFGFVRGQAGGRPAQLVGLFQKRQGAWEQRLASRVSVTVGGPGRTGVYRGRVPGLDLLPQRWSVNARPRGGPAEVELLGGGHEIAPLAQLHEVIVAPWEVPPTSRENAGRGGAGGCRAMVET